MVRKFSGKFFNAMVLVLVLTLAVPWAAFADDLVADGDGLAPIANSSLNFGNVCANTTVEKSVLVAVKATGHPGTGNNTFANSSTVTVSPGMVTGTGLSADAGANIVLPIDWTIKPNQTLSSSSSPKVTLKTGAAGTSFSGSVVFNASGKRASDGASLTKSETITVNATVVACDSTPPSLNLPANITEEATSSGGAVVTYTATATDANPASPTVTCSPASGSTFAIATTTVNCESTDAAGNKATGSFKVTVQDTKGPVFENKLPVTSAVEATSGSGAVVEYTNPTATDAVDGARTVTCSPASGSTFPLGITPVTCSASDTRDNSSSKTFEVKVQDTTAPVLSLPASIIGEATGPDGASVSYTASANDTVDGAITASCLPASDSIFALGETTVNCSAADAAGNKVTGSFSVTVRDTTPPALSLPSGITAEATGPNGAVINYAASASDLVSGNVAVNCLLASNSTFALGETTVNCSAMDAAGNKATGSFNVKVQDTTVPELKLPADMKVAATSAAGASVSYTASASDLVDATPVVSCAPASGSTFAIGTTKVDCSATDTSGNKATGSFSVTVTYDFRGFYQPVDTTTTSTIVWNTVKNGSTVPLKFEVFAGANDEITSTSAVVQPLKYTQINCLTGATDAIEELSSTNGTGLRYDTTGGQFIYNWQTPKLAGKCFAVQVSLTEGSSRIAYFQLK